MKVKNKKDGSRTFTYSGDLEKEISKVGKQLLKVEKELLFVEEAYSRVKKQRDSLLTRKENYRTFIRIGTEELKKGEKMNAVAQNLIGLRRASNLERKDVCKALGLLPTSYASYETGLRVPNLELLGEFARYYGVTVDYLIGQTDLVSKEECLQETLEMIKELGGVAGEVASSALEEWCYKEKAV